MKRIREWKTSTKWLVGTVTALLLVVVSVLGYGGWKLYQASEQIYEPVERLPSEARPEGVQDHEDSELETRDLLVKSFLILGIDKREGTTDRGRTDAIILAILNEQDQKITMLSIPRDSYVEIAGKGYKDKINHAFQYGLPTTIATVENLTGIPVDHYILFNFNSFKKAVDAIGGIVIDVDESIARYAYRQFGSSVQFNPGEQRLSGEEALYFARFRYDAQGDFGRNDRQQQVIKAFLDQTKDVRSPAKIEQLLDIVGEDVRTDLTFKDMVTLAKVLNGFSSEDVEQVKYQTHSKRMGPQNLWYELISEEERQRVSNKLKEVYNSSL
ncbi:hypothetical protein GCM10010965_28890 [Caldalkalibacillus thermarum]|uniref:LCP family protein n=1 Tax=Caldalkalibacillus thermarum TaxID=296745 RepID=UPI0016663527|nr:LCP family protein [Caldalkalibacillus thermarum]GGK34176.1 hypothetical protein GCM10010965_28890 [Caldalkalibacillus thermarum]